MKPANTRARNFIALLLAIIMAISLAGCNGSLDTGNAGNTGETDLSDVGIGDEITAPAPEGVLDGYWTGSGKDDKDDDSSTPTTQSSKKMTEKNLKPYGELVTVIKSVSKPTASNSKNVQDTKYGKVDWSMAAQGYIQFTAKGQERCFILQGPNDAKAMMTVQKGETIKVTLMDGTGKYQYAIANNTNNGKSYSVQYKNSFTVKTIDSDLAPYLVSNPYGDYENSPDMVKTVSGLWDTKKTQLQNVKEIAEWVSDAIKYDKTNKVGPLDAYVNPDVIIEKGTGVCNEMTKILVAALRSQGIPAYYQEGLNARGKSHAWVVAWVELSSETKNGTTYSTGTWITIEAIGGSLQPAKSVERNYTVGTYRN